MLVNICIFNQLRGQGSANRWSSKCFKKARLHNWLVPCCCTVHNCITHGLLHPAKRLYQNLFSVTDRSSASCSSPCYGLARIIFAKISWPFELDCSVIKTKKLEHDGDLRWHYICIRNQIKSMPKSARNICILLVLFLDLFRLSLNEGRQNTVWK